MQDEKYGCAQPYISTSARHMSAQTARAAAPQGTCCSVMQTPGFWVDLIRQHQSSMGRSAEHMLNKGERGPAHKPACVSSVLSHLPASTRLLVAARAWLETVPRQLTL